MIGLLLPHRPGRIRQVLRWILVSVGGWCCIMANPTTAAAIALVIMLYVFFLRQKSLLPMLDAALVALALLIVTAYLIDGGITGLVISTVNSAKMEILLGGRARGVSHVSDRLARHQSLATRYRVLVAIAFLLSILVGSTHKLLLSLALAAVLIVTIAIALPGTDPISIEPSTLFLVPAFTCLGAMFYREGLVLRAQTPTEHRSSAKLFGPAAPARTGHCWQLLAHRCEGRLCWMQLYGLVSFLRINGADTVSVASLDYVFDQENPLFARLEAFLRI